MIRVYHYTCTKYLTGILEAGELRPTMCTGFYAIPLLWFSAQPEWEPSAAALYHQKPEDCGALRFALWSDDPRLMVSGLLTTPLREAKDGDGWIRGRNGRRLISRQTSQ